MKRIPLTQNKYALVDDADFEWLNQWKWSLLQGRYAHRNAGVNGYIRMHRFIMDAPLGLTVDHINGDGLDNRRSNLRLCTQQENSMNSKVSKNSKSGLKDIFWQKDRQKWFVQIMYLGKKYHGGRFVTIEEAVQVRDRLIRKLHGEFSRTEA